MHFPTLLPVSLSLTLALQTTATPLTNRAIPVLGTSKAFHLQARITPGHPDLTTSINGHLLTGDRITQGVNIVVVRPLDPALAAPFYSNGSTTAGSPFSGIASDHGLNYPWGLRVAGPDSFDATYPAEHGVGINVGPGTDGLALHYSHGGGFVRLGGPLGDDGAGTYAVCPRLIPAVKAVINVVRYVYTGEAMPEGCVAVEFVPYCAVLDELPEGSTWTHEFVRDVQCFNEV